MPQAEFDEFEDSLGNDFITIRLSDMEPPEVNIGKINPMEAITWLEWAAEWIRKTIPVPRVIYDDMTVISGAYFFDEDEDENEEDSPLG